MFTKQSQHKKQQTVKNTLGITMQNLKKQMKELGSGSKKKTSHGIKDALENWSRVNRAIKTASVLEKSVLEKAKQEFTKDKLYYAVYAMVDPNSLSGSEVDEKDLEIIYAHFSTLKSARDLEHKINTAAEHADHAVRTGSIKHHRVRQSSLQHCAKRGSSQLTERPKVAARVMVKPMHLNLLGDSGKEELCGLIDKEMGVTVEQLETRIKNILTN